MQSLQVCPWQAGNILTLSARRYIHDPLRILGAYISEGMTLMDVGCGMGYFTIPMALMTGANGKVLAADLQPQMLEGMLQNAEKAGVRSRIEPRLCGTDSIHIGDANATVDFAILFMMLHEVPDRERLVREVCDALSMGGKILFAEPVVHVRKKSFMRSLQMMEQAGLTVISKPRVMFCRSALLEKTEICR